MPQTWSNTTPNGPMTYTLYDKGEALELKSEFQLPAETRVCEIVQPFQRGGVTYNLEMVGKLVVNGTSLDSYLFTETMSGPSRDEMVFNILRVRAHPAAPPEIYAQWQREPDSWGREIIVGVENAQELADLKAAWTGIQIIRGIRSRGGRPLNSGQYGGREEFLNASKKFIAELQREGLSVTQEVIAEKLSLSTRHFQRLLAKYKVPWPPE